MAIVGAIADREQTIHSWVRAGVMQFMPFPHVLLIEGDSTSVMLFPYRCDGEGCGDTWHASLEEAQGQAEHEYGTALGPWRKAPKDVDNAPGYAVAFVKKHRDAK
jgi:hypothetical protein